MGKKKRGHPDVEEILARPWCYYCERDFDDLKILINHQKAKHFKCERCGRRLMTAGGLNVHMTQVHKETLTQVENALANRSGLDYEIFGMEGIPEDVLQAHNQRVLQQYYEQQAERRAATGNPPPGTGTSNAGNNGPKKPKLEPKESLKARLAAHKAKKAAEAAGESSGDVTPVAAQSPAAFPQAVSPGYHQPQMPYSAPQGSPPQAAYVQPYGQPSYPAQSSPFSQQPPYAQQPPFPAQQGYGAPPYPAPGAAPFSPTGQQYPQPAASPYQASFPGGPPRQPGSGSPSVPYPYGAHQPPPSRTPPNNAPGQQRQGSLPAAPGLPSRPAFAAPQVNAFQMQQMHQGHVPPPANGPPGGFANGPAQTNGHGQPPAQESIPGLEASVDELISSAGQQAAAPKEETAEQADKKAKKKDDKNINLVYSDNHVSPEEKMAQLPRYAFDPAVRIKDERVVGAVEPAVTGITTGPGDVIDRTE